MESHGDFLKVLVSRCSHAFRNLKVFFDRVAISSASTDQTILLLAGLKATTLKLEIGRWRRC
jgi:hypothetical protein